MANTSGIAGEPPLFVFSINHSSGALTPVATYGQDGQVARNVLFSTGTASAAYTPTFAYATNSGSQSITELSIAKGGLGFVKGSPLTDSNGPQASVATADGKFFYTGNSNGSISEYAIGKTGALTKITGSPITGLANVTALAVDPFYQLLYAVDPTSDEVHTFQINPKTGVLTAGPVSALAGAPLSTAIDLDGLVFVTLSSSELDFGVDGFGFQGTVATGANPVAVTVDPSDQYVYVANSGGNSVSAFAIENRGFALTPVSGSPFAAGTSPSAVVAEPYGKYLYVANSGSSTISAYSIEPFTGALTPISGTFTTLSGPSALSVSNDGKYLYVTDKTAGELQQFTINSDGTLTAAGSAGLGTAPSSLTAIGTYK